MKSNNENFIVYKCAPEKNTKCRKTDCQTLCFHTTERKYSRDGKKYIYNVKDDKYDELDG